jgi:predicted TIM-barrel fold metal-dependent hydrolase
MRDALKMVAHDKTTIRRDYLLKDYLVDAAPHHVVGPFDVEAMRDAADFTGETVWLSGICDALSIPMVFVAQAKLDPPEVEGVLAQQASFIRS